MMAALKYNTTVLIVNYNAGELLLRTVGAVLNRVSPVKLIIVDNASVDNSLQLVIEQFGIDLEIIRNEKNLGFGPACNQGVESCTTDFVLILNTDCELPDKAIRVFENAMSGRPRAALMSGLVVGDDQLEQRGSRRRLPTPGAIMREVLGIKSGAVDQRHLSVPDTITAVEAVSGACMFVRRSAFISIGGFDEGYKFHFEDLDLMKRLQDNSWEILLVPELVICHIGGVSGRRRPLWVSRNKHLGLLRYLRKHCSLNVALRIVIPVLVWLHFVLMIPFILSGVRKP